MSAIPDSNSVAKSLQEIAKLLLNLFERYFLEVDAEILVSMVILLRDIGAIRPPIAIKDIVNVLLNENTGAAVSAMGEVDFSYERFYNWLRGVAALLYPDEANSRKSFHRLLVEHILPFVSKINSSSVDTDELTMLSDKALSTLSYFDDYCSLWFSTMADPDTANGDISLRIFIDALTESRGSPLNELQKERFYRICMYWVYDSARGPPINQERFWATLQSYRIDYNQFIIVISAIFLERTGARFDTGMLRLLENLSELRMDLVLNSIVNIDEDFRAFLLPARSDASDKVDSGLGKELWSEERVHICSIWWFARQAGMLTSWTVLNHMYNSTMAATNARERLDIMFPGASRQSSWTQSVLSSFHLLVVHASSLDDLVFDLVDFEYNSARKDRNNEISGRSLDFLRSAVHFEGPCRTAFLNAGVLFAQTSQIDYLIRYAYFPYCIYQLLESFEFQNVFELLVKFTEVKLHENEAKSGADHNANPSLQSLLEMLEYCQVTPAWISPEQCLIVANHVCIQVARRKVRGSRNVESHDILAMNVDILDVYEVLFAVSQVCSIKSPQPMESADGTGEMELSDRHRNNQLDYLRKSRNAEDIHEISVHVWDLFKKLISKILQTNVLDITKNGNETDVVNGLLKGIDVKIGATDTASQLIGRDVLGISHFDDNLTAVLCSSLYATSQPHWRGRWLLKTAATHIPISSYPLDTTLKCTQDVVLFTALLFYPYGGKTYNLWNLFKLFGTCSVDDGPSKNIPKHEFCARRMYIFLREISGRYKIRTVSLISYLRRSLLADEIFADCTSGNNDLEEVRIRVVKSLDALGTLSSTVLALSSKKIWMKLSSAENAIIWDYLLAAATCTYSVDQGGAFEPKELGVNVDLVINMVPNIDDLEAGRVILSKDVAISWFQIQFSGIDGMGGTKSLGKDAESFFILLRQFRRVCFEQQVYTTFCSFAIFVVYVHLKQNMAVSTVIEGWLDRIETALLSCNWDGSIPTSSFFLSSKMLFNSVELDVLKEILKKSLRIFDAIQKQGLSPSLAGAVLAVSAVPPRPPSRLWDAPRCMQYCHVMGITEFICHLYGRAFRNPVHSGMNIIWRSVLHVLQLHYNSAKLSPWTSHNVVPPLPFNADADALFELLSAVATNTFVTYAKIERITLGELIMSTICPVIVSYEQNSKYSKDGFVSPVGDFLSGRALEDILRLGGSKVMCTLADYEPWLAEEFCFMREQFLCNAGIGNTYTAEDILFVPLMEAMKYFSCNGLLKMKTIITISGLVLNPRLRAELDGCVCMDHILNSDVNIAVALRAECIVKVDDMPRKSVFPLTFIEFSELFLRCGFALYEQANCLTSSRLMRQATSFEHCKTPEMKENMNYYCDMCDKLTTAPSRAGLSSQFTAGSWGCDFLYPYASTMQLISSKRARKTFGRHSIGLSLPESRIVAEASVNFDGVKRIPNYPTQMVGNEAWLEGHGINDDCSSSVPNVNEKAKEPKGDVSCLSSIPLGTGVNIVDDAIIRGRDKYLETILADRQQHQFEVTSTTEFNKTIVSPLQLKLSVPTKLSSGRRSPGTFSPARSPHGSPRSTRSPRKASPQSPLTSERSISIDALLDGTKEVLWPVFATYCSCGDSMEPGKLSGPNLFALLSKLNVLTDETTLSDIGVLLHQVSSHTTAQTPAASLFVDNDEESGLESPLLTFEEFLVFLCAFSHLRYEGTSVLPDFASSSNLVGSRDHVIKQNGSSSPANISTDSISNLLETNGPTAETWLDCWYHVMITSPSFRRLLEECVLPLLQKQALLAFPEDARHRDAYILIFSIEVLMTIQSNEHHLRNTFERHRDIDRTKAKEGVRSVNKLDHFVIEALERIKIVPQKVSRTEVLQFVEDILPKLGKISGKELTFPQWEWVLCIVAVKAVNNAVGRNSTLRDARAKILIPFVSEVLAALAAAIVQSAF